MLNGLQPKPVTSLQSYLITHVSAEHSAIVTVDGAIKTWGWGEHGQLGLGNTNDQTAPQTVSLGPDVQNKEAFLNVYCGSGIPFAIRYLSSINPDNISRN